MLKKISIFSFAVVIAIFTTGCTKQPEYTPDRGDALREKPVSMGVDREDYLKAADEVIQSLMDSAALKRIVAYEKRITNNEFARLVVMIGKFKNDTTQKVDIDRLIKKVRIALINSGDFAITAAVGGGGAEDDAIEGLREELKGKKAFKQSTIAKDNNVIAPKYNLMGKIAGGSTKRNDGDTQMDYVFQLSLVDLNSGVTVWEGESYIGKKGDGSTVSW